MIISREVAYQIWNILRECCGASEDSYDSIHFADVAETQGITEWRFGGSLGFGGKFWANKRPGQSGMVFYVSCYREHETPERSAMIQNANERLYRLAYALYGGSGYRTGEFRE